MQSERLIWMRCVSWALGFTVQCTLGHGYMKQIFSIVEAVCLVEDTYPIANDININSSNFSSTAPPHYF